MAKWLVKVKGYVPGVYKGTVTEKGKEYVLVSWDRFSAPHYVRNANFYSQKFPIKVCKIYRQPGRVEKAIKQFFVKLFKRS